MKINNPSIPFLPTKTFFCTMGTWISSCFIWLKFFFVVFESFQSQDLLLPAMRFFGELKGYSLSRDAASEHPMHIENFRRLQCFGSDLGLYSCSLMNWRGYRGTRFISLSPPPVRTSYSLGWARTLGGSLFSASCY